MSPLNKISVVVPVYNSESLLEELVQRLNVSLAKENILYEIILIDDGSKDNSWITLEKIQLNYKNVTAIKLTKNYGQHAALLCGFTFCQGDVIVTIDDDLQYPPEEISKLISKFKESNADVVYGLAENRQHSNVRKVSSKAVTLTSIDGNHQGSSFRLIKSKIIEKLTENHKFNFVFIDTLLNWYTSSFSEVRVQHEKRKKGQSGYSLFKLFKLHFNTMINYSVLPLRILIFGGLLLSFITFLFGIYFILKKILFSAPLGYTSIIVTILFSTSLIILGLGFIGLYVHKIYESNLRKPNYFIQRVISSKNDH